MARKACAADLIAPKATRVQVRGEREFEMVRNGFEVYKKKT
jgi:hypothetical protein